MHQTSALYNSILESPNCRMEERVRINGVYYGTDYLISVNVYGNLFARECPSVGNCNSRSFKLRMKTPAVDIPLESKVELFVRITDGTNTSEWIPKGVFYIDHRDKEKTGSGEDTYMDLSGYDALMKMQTEYPTANFKWPRTALAVLNGILWDNGKLSHDGTVTDTREITEPEAGMTNVDVMGYIAAMFGGNFYIDDSGVLRLARLQKTESGATTIMPKQLKIGDPLAPVAQVTLHKMDGTSFVAVHSTREGRNIDVDTPWATQANANYLVGMFGAYRYVPFTAIDTVINPAVELGDTIRVRQGNEYFYETVYKESYSFGSVALATLEAPPLKEMDHLYYPNKNRMSAGMGRALGMVAARADNANLQLKNDFYQIAEKDPDGKWGIAKSVLASSLTDKVMVPDPNNPGQKIEKDIFLQSLLELIVVKDTDGSYKSLSQLKSIADNANAGLANKVEIKDGMTTSTAILSAAVGNAVSQIKLESFNGRTLAQISADLTKILGALEVEGVQINQGDIRINGTAWLKAASIDTTLTVQQHTFEPEKITSYENGAFVDRYVLREA